MGLLCYNIMQCSINNNNILSFSGVFLFFVFGWLEKLSLSVGFLGCYDQEFLGL